MFGIANLLSNGINYVFGLLVLLAPFVSRRAGLGRALPFWVASAVGLGVGILFAEWGKHLPIWPNHPTFPSGHETFALACATSLIWWDRRWAVLVVPLAVVLAWALVVAGWHRTPDVIGSLLTGPPPAFLAQGLAAFAEKSRAGRSTFAD